LIQFLERYLLYLFFLFPGAHPMSVINKIVWLNDKVLVTAAQDSNVKQWNIE
jgi:hypothetical protein